jgi:hypothetical protein
MTPIEEARACLAYAKRHLHNEVVMREQILAAEKLLADAIAWRSETGPKIWDATNERWL